LIDDGQTYLPEILVDEEEVGDGIYSFLLIHRTSTLMKMLDFNQQYIKHKHDDTIL
jgi:hypothetical protein